MSCGQLQRRTIRLPEFDYAQDGAYFVTLCAHQRECLFGAVDTQGTMRVNDLGDIVRDEWLKTAVIRAYVVLDDYVVMPNHFHAILFIIKSEEQPQVRDDNKWHDVSVGAQRAAPLQKPHVTPQSLGAIVRGFKSAATKRINEHRHTPGAPVWQRNYYEHVIRNESGLNDIRSYIQMNPARWTEDTENPANVNLGMGIYQ